MIPIRVIIVDDHKGIRELLKKCFGEEPDIQVVGEFPSGEDALKGIKRGSFDVLVTDLWMKSLNGIELVKRLREMIPETLALIWSVATDAFYVSQAKNAGAQGYISKSASFDYLVSAVRTITRQSFHGFYVSPDLSPNVDGATGYNQTETTPPVND